MVAPIEKSANWEGISVGEEIAHEKLMEERRWAKIMAPKTFFCPQNVELTLTLLQVKNVPI